MNQAFQIYKLKRAIQREGSSFTFVKKSLNEFKEPIGEDTQVTIPGIFHEEAQLVRSTTETSAQSKDSRTATLIMCLASDAVGISYGMTVTIGNTEYRVTNVDPVSHVGVAADISLEEVVHG